MEQQNVNNLLDAKFKIISRFLSDALRNAEFSEIIYSKGRSVFTVTSKGIKEVVIPSKNNQVLNWQHAWLNVFANYLKALDDKVGSLFVNSHYVRQDGENSVKVGDNPAIEVPNDYNSVEYGQALEKIIIQYNQIKKAELLHAQTQKISPIVVTSTSVQIDNPEKAIASLPATPIPVGIKDVTPVKAASPSTNLNSLTKDITLEPNQVHTKRMPMPSKLEKHLTTKDTEILTISKLPAEISLDKKDCANLSDQTIIVTCTGIKHGDGLFRDNVDMLKEHANNIQIESFISGRATNLEQAAKEAGKIIKMLNDCQVGSLVIYELNNDFILEHAKKLDAVKECLTAVERLCDALSSENYTPVICRDLKVDEFIRDNIPEYQDKYHTIKCVTVKQKDMIGDEDIVYMNPSSEMDLVMFNTPEIQNYFNNHIQEEQPVGTLSVAA